MGCWQRELIPTQEHRTEDLSKGVLQVSLAEIAGDCFRALGFRKHLQGQGKKGSYRSLRCEIYRGYAIAERTALTHAEHYLSREEAVLIKAKVYPQRHCAFCQDWRGN